MFAENIPPLPAVVSRVSDGMPAEAFLKTDCVHIRKCWYSDDRVRAGWMTIQCVFLSPAMQLLDRA